jgi:hypothetical protein
MSSRSLKRPPVAGIFRIGSRFWTLDLVACDSKWPIVSGQSLKFFRFEESGAEGRLCAALHGYAAAQLPENSPCYGHKPPPNPFIGGKFTGKFIGNRK